MKLPVHLSVGFPLCVVVAVLSGSCELPRSVSLLDNVEKEDIDLGGVSKPAISRKFLESLELEVTLPARPELELSMAVTSSNPVPRARPQFYVRVVSDERTIDVYERTLKAHEHNRWHDVHVNLAALAGKKVTLQLGTRVPWTDKRVPWKNRIRIAWGNPVVVSRAPVPTLEPPSVIMILVDTLRYDYLGLHGFEGDISHNLDWLGLESLRFDHAIAPAPWTKPSVASLFTGLYPDTHGVLDQKEGLINPDATDALSSQAETIAEVFRANGYDTAAFVGNGWLAPELGFSQGFDTYVVGLRDDANVARARKWLQSRSKGKPYFLYLHLKGAHGPYRALEQDYTLLKDSPSLGPAHRIGPSDSPRPQYLEATPFRNDEERQQIRLWRAKYAATVRKMDRTLGELINELRSNGELARSYVVFTADHGEEFLEHGRWVHGYNLCCHQLHVPLWIREPGAVSAGRRVDRVVSLVDVLPTLLNRLSLPIPESVQGEDRYPEVHQAKGSDRPGPDGAAIASGLLDRPSLYALRTARHHLIWDSASGEVSLYDLEEDPQETLDLSSQTPETALQLEEKLLKQLEVIESAGRLAGERPKISEELRERLRALGYIQ